jgi:transketolase
MTYEDCLREISRQDERVIVMTAENRAAIRNLPASLGPRFVDVGICEQTMVGAAAGLALRGRRPVIHALSTFLTLRAFEFIRTDIGIGNLPVTLVGGVPGFLSEANGPTHQAIEDIALMRGIPNMQVFCPADEEELVGFLPAIVSGSSPTYIRYNASAPPVTHHGPFDIGKAEIISEGDDITILVHGFLLREAVRAAEILRSASHSVRLINLRMLEPVDAEAILNAARETRLLVTIEDHFLNGGLYALVAEICLAKRVTPHVLPFALDNRWFKPALLDDVLEHEGFRGDQIATRILSFVHELPQHHRISG